ncbi:MAG TPA: 2Fe-2S iron-sulfur cluster-binding protein, partial [Candidatus Limnocylindria bacterium]|nr:2Fe-2S iron-sulfur cluster-binding protein [Candidatus Limnocylindria bacterium]
MSTHVLHFTLNGDPRQVSVPADRLLLELLRDDLGATGTKEGCSIGVCGICTVLLDDEVVS